MLGDSDLEITRNKLRQKSGLLEMEDSKKKSPRFVVSSPRQQQLSYTTSMACQACASQDVQIDKAYTREFDSESGATFYVTIRQEKACGRNFGLGRTRMNSPMKAKFEKTKKDASALLKPSVVKPSVTKMTPDEAVVRLQELVENSSSRGSTCKLSCSMSTKVRSCN